MTTRRHGALSESAKSLPLRVKPATQSVYGARALEGTSHLGLMRTLLGARGADGMLERMGYDVVERAVDGRSS